MALFLVTRKNTFDPTNTVYFAETLEDAVALRDQFIAAGGEWIVAQIMDPQP